MSNGLSEQLDKAKRKKIERSHSTSSISSTSSTTKNHEEEKFDTNAWLLQQTLMMGIIYDLSKNYGQK